jgi:hypothetical protein
MLRVGRKGSAAELECRYDAMIGQLGIWPSLCVQVATRRDPVPYVPKEVCILVALSGVIPLSHCIRREFSDTASQPSRFTLPGDSAPLHPTHLRLQQSSSTLHIINSCITSLKSVETHQRLSDRMSSEIQNLK